MIRRWGMPSRLALGALALAVAIGIAAAIAARRLEPLPVTSAAPVIDLGMAVVPPRGGRASESLVMAAVARHPFRPDRTRPASRYQLPAERRAAAERASRLPPAVARMRLLGTATLPGGEGLAALELPGSPPRVIRVGQVVEGLRLLSVQRGMATFESPDTTFTLSLSSAAGERRR